MVVNWPLVVATLTVLASSTSYILLIQASKGEDGFAYSFILVLLLTAIVKAVISAFLLIVHNFRHPGSKPSFSVQTFLYFTASAALYCVNDTFVFIVMSFFDSVSYTILVTGKLGIVAFLTRTVLKRRLTQVQYTSVLILGCGIVTNQYQFCSTEEGAPWKGYIIVCVAELIGACAGICNEYLMKRTEQGLVANTPVHFYNLNLYIASILILTPTLFIWQAQAKVKDLSAGMTPLVGVMILVNAVRGISISMIYKLSTNMTKVFIITVSMLITGIVSWQWFGYELGVQFFLSSVIIACALYLYSSQTSEKIEAPGSRRMYAEVSDVGEFDHELGEIQASIDTQDIQPDVGQLDD